MEATRLTPHIEKNLAQEILGKRPIADEAEKPAVDVGPMPGQVADIEIGAFLIAAGNGPEKQEVLRLIGTLV